MAESFLSAYMRGRAAASSGVQQRRNLKNIIMLKPYESASAEAKIMSRVVRAE